MPLPRFYKLSDERRRQILDAARAEFAEHGFEGSSFNRIIAAAGVSKGAMYYYFADKADAYGAVLDDVLDRVDAVAAELEPPTDAEGYWRSLADGTAVLNEAFVHDEQLGRLIRDLYGSAGAGPTFARLMERCRGWVRRLLTLGQRLGAVRQDVPLPMLTEAVTGMFVAVDRWAATAILTMEPQELVTMSEKLLELTRDMLERRGADTPVSDEA